MSYEKIKQEEFVKLLDEQNLSWDVSDNKVTKVFSFNDYMSGVDFVNKVADISNNKDHHPDIYIGYKQVKISFTTHSADGLTQKDLNMVKLVSNI